MKSKIGFVMVTLVSVALFISCASLPVPAVPGAPSAKSVVKKAVTVPKVEVLECTMAKTDVENENALDNLTITGMAVYHPVKVGAKAFKDYAWDINISFYDMDGKKLPFKINALDCGDYGKAENVLPGEAFPFKGEIGTAYIGIENFKNAVTCKVTRFDGI